MLWPVPGVVEEPDLSLESWQVFETNTGERHLVGYCIERWEGRATSAIVAFDAVNRVVITKSGRSYALRGGPSVHPDAIYVWSAWKVVNAVTSETDITARVWDEIKKARENAES